jgi:hypothetical protein
MLVIYKDCTDLQGQQSMKFRESWLKLLCGGGALFIARNAPKPRVDKLQKCLNLYKVLCVFFIVAPYILIFTQFIHQTDAHLSKF